MDYSKILQKHLTNLQTIAIQKELGKTIDISIDDGDLYYSFSLNKGYQLQEESIKIFKLSD